MTAIPKPKRIRDAKYLKFVREQGCVFLVHVSLTNPEAFDRCQGEPVDAHHVKPEGGGITGSKVSDYRAVGLCRQHHQLVESRPIEYRKTLELAAKALNLAYRKLQPIAAPRKTRTLQPVAKLRIEHCICGKQHPIRWAEVVAGLSVAQDGQLFSRVRCPVTNKEQEARLA